VYTCDPRQVPDARLLKSMSYQEAMELSYFGAKVLHPRTIAIAQFQIPCLIKNTGNPQAPGTLIGASRERRSAGGISNLNNMAMFNVSGPGMKGMVGMAARVFATMSRAGISVVLITQSSSEYSISFCVPQSDCARAKRAMEDEFYLELKEGCWSRWRLWSVWRLSPWWATVCAPCAVSRRNSLPRWPRQYQYRGDCPGLFRALISVVVSNDDDHRRARDPSDAVQHRSGVKCLSSASAASAARCWSRSSASRAG
jgi:hypothetical protein